MKWIIFYMFVFCFVELFGQNQRILSFNLFDGTVDTLNQVDFDSTIVREMTNYFVGKINNDLNDLKEEPPVDNIYKGSSFTRKRQASLDFNINNYPIRTSVKLLKIINDSLKSQCSGSLISSKHVLTAGHCVAQFNKDILLYDSLFVCPVLDNGQFNNNFECSLVKRIFIFENWDMSNSDFSVLELDKSVGDETGWISIGFESNDSLLLDGIFYKFSYPAVTLLLADSNSYNGDTLYYCYGKANIIESNNFGVRNAIGIPGESGSSLIKVENNKTYTSYGVSSWSHDIIHCRLTNWQYYAIKSIIFNDLTIGNPNIKDPQEINIFPNPTLDYLNIIYSGENNLSKIIIFDLNGRKVLEETNLSNEIKLNLTSLFQGTYILVTYTDEKYTISKIIKTGNNNANFK